MAKIELKPASVFRYFAEINQIPRPSKHEEKMIEYLKNFGKSHNLETLTDKTGNVLIRKAATPGYENSPRIVLQSHMDMVCDKLVDREFNFETDPIETYVEGEWLKAKGTTLGADDGIGCAIELAILDADDIEHGPLECLFTRDEETGLTGAFGLESGFMQGDMLINLDSEDEGQIFVSCAGGRTTKATFHFHREAPGSLSLHCVPSYVSLQIKGLFGGHSGDDINKKRANAIKLLARFLYMENEKFGVRLVAFDSGKMHNAIPRDGKVRIIVPEEKVEELKADWKAFEALAKDEYHVTENAMEFILKEDKKPLPIIPQNVSNSIIRALQAIDNGVLAMCQDKEIDWLVETSSNVASVLTTDDTCVIVASQRSCVMSQLDNMCNTVKALFQLAGADVEQGDGYPAWKMNPDSKLTAATVEAYREVFGKDPIVLGIHAGLECGLFSERYPNMDMVSFGPTLRNVHTPEEKLHIPTVDMVWQHILHIFKKLK